MPAIFPWHSSGGAAHLSGAAGPSYAVSTPPSFDGNSFQAVGNFGFKSNNSRFDAEINNLADFFGEPDPGRVERLKAGGVIDYDERPQDKYEQEFQDYPEAFHGLYANGRNGYLSRVMLEKAKASDRWQLRRMAPWGNGETEGLEKAWDMVLFHKHMLDRSPEESVPRMLTSTRSSGRASLVRYGIALMLESNFASTPIGRRTYRYNIEQLRIATVETASYGAMIAVMEHKPFNDNELYETYNSTGVNTRSQLDRMFSDETRSWGIMHKERDAMAGCVSKLRTQLSKRGVSRGDFLIVPEGLHNHAARAKIGSFYLDGGRSETVDKEHLTIVESVGFSQGLHTVPHDPCFRHQTIGGFFTLNDMHLKDIDPRQYRTSMLDSVGYDEGRDEFYRWSYTDLNKYHGIWHFDDEDGRAPLTESIGMGYARGWGCYTHGQLLRKAGQWERFKSKLETLTPQQLRELSHSLTLLDPTDVRVMKNGMAFPGADEFQSQLLDEMVSDQMMRPVPSVADFRSMEGRRRAGHFVPTEEEDRLAQAGRKRVRRSPEEMFNDGVPAESDVVMEDDFHIEGDQAIKVSGAKRSVRRVPGTTEDPHNTELDYAGTTANGRRVAALIGKITRHAKDCNKAQASDSASVAQKKEEANVEISDSAANLCERIQQQMKTNESMLLVCLTQLERVVKDVVAGLRESGAKKTRLEFETEVMMRFGSFLLPYELRSILMRGNTSGQTPLEAANAKLNADPSHPQDPDLAKAGWWDPSEYTLDAAKKAIERNGAEPEDGQIKLGLLLTGDAQGAEGPALPHDAFAITLAAQHSVFFQIEQESREALTALLQQPSLSIPIKGSYKRARGDALVWSIILSLIISVANQEALLKSLGAVIQAHPDTKKRLQRHASQLQGQTNVLVSQRHLYEVIDTASAYLRQLLEPAQGQSELNKNTASTLAKLVTQGRALGHVGRRLLLTEVIKNGFAATPDPKLPKVAPRSMPDDPTVLQLLDEIDRAAISDGRFILACLDLNLPPALALRGFRPHKTYVMASMVCMNTLGRDKAATTYYKNPDFQMSENSAQKLIFGHYTVYFKTIVEQPQSIAIARNIYTTGYVGGNGVLPWNPLDPEHVRCYQEGDLICDVFVTAVLMNRSHAPTFWLPCSGSMPATLSVEKSVADMVHYVGCEAVAKHWQWMGDNKSFDPSEPYRSTVDPVERKFNTICMQEFQLRQNPQNYQWDQVVLDKGHWGDNIMPGFGKVISGHQSIFNEADYKRSNSIQLH
jgi:hypothetical protein